VYRRCTEVIAATTNYLPTYYHRYCYCYNNNNNYYYYYYYCCYYYMYYY